MEATKKNEQLARQIINLLAEKECTVAEAEEILRYVRQSLGRFTTVRKVEKELF
ncbi:MAG: hypothetical protein H0Z35_13645 [Thermoanaerobacteraceae bacterium]|nr:hypothetical protein [Thermoanaerobacteraceae bacterium]